MSKRSGIAVSELKRLSEEYPLLTTRELCGNIIRRVTTTSLISYCDLLRRNGFHDLVGNHSYFISHCWDYNFSLVVQSIVDYPEIQKKLKKNIPVFVWFDVFSFNQHDPIRSKEFLRLIKRTIKRSVCTLSVWVPHNLPTEEIIPQLPLLTRVWCLFEWFYTYKEEDEVEFIMPTYVRDSYKFSLLFDVKYDHLDDFEDLDFIDDISNIDIKESTAT
eukprot:gene8340-9022_t